MYTWLNHLNVTLSYNAVLKLVSDISEKHRAPLERWIGEGASVKFIGDNMERKRGVKDIRSDHHGEVKHMYSMLAVKARVKPPSPVPHFVPPDISSHKVCHFLPTASDLSAITSNLVVLVSRDLCKYIKVLKRHNHSLVRHIPHTHSSEMATKSVVAVLDVLHKTHELDV